jgi:hypothetical protein
MNCSFQLPHGESVVSTYRTLVDLVRIVFVDPFQLVEVNNLAMEDQNGKQDREKNNGSSPRCTAVSCFFQWLPRLNYKFLDAKSRPYAL